MTFKNEGMTVAELSEHVSGLVVGDANTVVGRLASLASAREGDISFFDDLKYLDVARESKASCLIVPKDALSLPGEVSDSSARRN